MQRALIVEDETLLCEVYQRILETLQIEEKVPPLFTTICKDFKTALTAIDRMSRNNHMLDLCILDYRLGTTKSDETKNGLEIGLLVNQLFPHCKILVITGIVGHYVFHSVLEHLKPAGFLIKNDTHLASLKRDFSAVWEGETVYSKQVSTFIKRSGSLRIPLDGRDLELLHLMDKGFTLPEIGHKIGLSLSGIEYRKRKIATSIGANSASIQDVLKTAKQRLKLI
ncbi:MAG: hypothetical protein AAGF96_22280 [Bacteroidota bacterium]